MQTKWFSVKRYEFEVFVFGIVLMVGSWVLYSKFGAPELLVFFLMIIGFVFTILSTLYIILRLISPLF